MKMLKITPERCTHCMLCELACSYVQNGSFQPSQSVIKVQMFDNLAIYAPYTCFQCAEAWCMTACPVNAITIHPETGAKVVLGPACVGCKLCVIACPFGTAFYNPDTGKATKCTLCDGDPACARACPTAAIEWTEVTGRAPWLEPWADRTNDVARRQAALTGVRG